MPPHDDLPEVERRGPIVRVPGNFVTACCAGDLGNLRVRVPAGQLIAPSHQRVEHSVVIEPVGGVEIALFTGQVKELDQHFAHAAVLDTEHRLKLLCIEAGRDRVDPAGERGSPGRLGELR